MNTTLFGRVPAGLFLALCLMVFGSPAVAWAQEGTDHRSSEGLPFLVTVPDGYGEGDDAPPVLLFLHGGDRSNTRHHPARYAADAGLSFPFLVVAPHCTSGCNWQSVDFVALIEDVAKSYSIDRSRIYLTGYSMGAYGAWDLLTKEPDLIAAAAPIAGGGDTSAICAASGVPIRAYHGDADTVIPHSQSVAMVEALQECSGIAELITLPGVDHGSWVPTFKDPEFYAWLLSHRR